MLKKNISLMAIKFIIMIILVFLITRQVHWYDYVVIEDGKSVIMMGIISNLKQVDVFILSFALLCTLISYCLVGYRWKRLLAVLSIPISVKDAIRYTFIGYFFSQIIPGMIGGDALKAYLFAKNTSKKVQIFVSVFVDRIFGIFGFALLAAIMLLIIWWVGLVDIHTMNTPLISIFVIFISIIGVTAILLNPQLHKLMRLERLYQYLSFSNHIKDAFDTIYLFRKNSVSFLIIVWFTFIAQLFGICTVMLIGFGLDLQIAWYFYFLYVPLIIIISAVPVTPGGVGLMEGLYLVYFSSVTNNSKVLVLAVLVRFIIIISTLFGGFIVFLDKKVFMNDLKEARRSIK